MSMSPILSLLGERADILLYMRGAMLPLFAISIACTYIIARRLYDARIAMWSAVLLSLLPAFFLKSLEFRTDNLWDTWWLLAVVTITGGSLRPARFFVTGLILGCALVTSLKTSLLVITLIAATTMTIAAGLRVPVRRTIAAAAAAFAGFAIVPAAVAALFVIRGGWPAFIYCTVTFNTLVAQTAPHLPAVIKRFAFLPALFVIVRVAWRNRATDRWRFFFGFSTAFFFAALLAFWTLVSPRDFLPFLPFLVIFGVAAVRNNTWYLVAAALCVAGLFHYTARFADKTPEQIAALGEALRLSHPGELVIDFHGETIYRQRPHYYVFELITRRAIRAGLLPDSIPEDVQRAQCHVAAGDGEFWPTRARAFLNQHFIRVGTMRTAGKWIRSGQPFTIGVEGDYVVVDRDGIAFGPMRLTRGEHTFDGRPAGVRLAVMWAPAFERGFSPYRALTH